MADAFNFELVSPERLLVSEKVTEVVIPATLGEMTVARARKIERFLSQPFFVAEVFTGSPGKLVALEDTIKGFKGLVNGEYDHLPEAAFYMVGSIEEAMEKAKKLAAAA